ncbi:MAG: diacylglycerol kinase [Chloroflexi bacterium HGW-Chloroflexi-8]|nr:MAG: diacylglycerol kinase [Chloroflexi bacterium HGW-Chloroflexi-8]
MKNYLIGRLKSFIPAFQGIYFLLSHEKNALIHLLATIFAIAMGLTLNISTVEWLFVGLAITLVWVAELFNSSLEKLTDLSQPGYHPIARITKDFAAGAVLMTTFYSIFVAAIIFLPKIFDR